MKLKPIVSCIALGLLPATLYAATLETAVNALALPAGASYSANDWSSTDSISGIRWKHKGLRETPASDFTRLGQMKLEHLGNATVFYSGARSMITQLEVTLSEADGKIFEKERFNHVLKAQFGKTTTIKPLRGVCPDEDGISGSAVFEVVLPQKKPVYVMVSTDGGGNAPNSRTSGFQFSLEAEERWKCSP